MLVDLQGMQGTPSPPYTLVGRSCGPRPARHTAYAPSHTQPYISYPGHPLQNNRWGGKRCENKRKKTNAGHGILRLKCILSIVAIKCRSRGPACWSINKNALMLQGQHVTGPLFMFVQLEQGLQMARNYNNPLFRADIIRWPVNWG